MRKLRFKHGAYSELLSRAGFDKRSILGKQFVRMLNELVEEADREGRLTDRFFSTMRRVVIARLQAGAAFEDCMRSGLFTPSGAERPALKAYFRAARRAERIASTLELVPTVDPAKRLLLYSRSISRKSRLQQKSKKR